jgi:hypothetical protein
MELSTVANARPVEELGAGSGWRRMARDKVTVVTLNAYDLRVPVTLRFVRIEGVEAWIADPTWGQKRSCENLLPIRQPCVTIMPQLFAKQLHRRAAEHACTRTGLAGGWVRVWVHYRGPSSHTAGRTSPFRLVRRPRLRRA